MRRLYGLLFFLDFERFFWIEIKLEIVLVLFSEIKFIFVILSFQMLSEFQNIISIIINLTQFMVGWVRYEK
jgi:hypothetical protein